MIQNQPKRPKTSLNYPKQPKTTQKKTYTDPKQSKTI